MLVAAPLFHFQLTLSFLSGVRLDITSCDAADSTGRLHIANMQVDGQQSPSAKFPSSHSSPARMPLPQRRP